MNIKGIVIDAGHGGDDPGASGNSIVEKDLALKISQELYDKLKLLGIPVYLTRTVDETLSPSERTDRILKAFGNDKNVIVVSNHINAGGGDGAEVIYALRNTSTLSNLILDKLNEEGQNVRKAYQRRLPSDTSKDYYFIHRDTGVTEPVIVEYGFLDSSLDDVNQLKNDYIKYADAVAEAIAEYVQVPYISDNTYIVKAGDSLWSIARKYNITVDELKNYNNLTSNLLSVGQLLEIPQNAPTEEYKTYIVKSGDTLYKIANDNDVTVDELIKFNNLNKTSLSIGQKLLIPLTNENSSKENYINYTVKAGDSLWKISQNYDVSVDELKRINNLMSNLLSIGQVLKIPTTNNSNDIEYIVKSGDSLWSIAKKYNTTVDELKIKNNLTSNLLSIGQKLLI